MSSTALREDISSTQSQLGFDAVTWQCSTICDGEDGDEHHVRPKQGVVTKKAPPQGGVGRSQIALRQAHFGAVQASGGLSMNYTVSSSRVRSAKQDVLLLFYCHGLIFCGCRPLSRRQLSKERPVGLVVIGRRAPLSLPRLPP